WGVKAPRRCSPGETVAAPSALSAGVSRRSDPAGTYERETARTACPRVGHDERNAAGRWLKQADLDQGKRVLRAEERRARGTATAPTREPRPAGGARDPENIRCLLRRGVRCDPVSAYRFVEREKASHAVVNLCRVMGVCPSGCLVLAKTRTVEPGRGAEERFARRIRAIHQASRGPYGVPRIPAELASTGTCCRRKRIARLMRQAGLSGCHRRRRRRYTTRRDPRRRRRRMFSGSRY